MRARPVVWGIIVFVLALVLLAALVHALLPFLNVDQYRNDLEALFSDTLGRTVKLEGPMTLSFSLHPALVLEEVRIDNPPWASRPDLVRATRLEVQLSLVPLLGRELVIDRILVEGADLLLEKGPNGEDNWTVGGASQPDVIPKVESQSQLGVTAITSLTVRRSTISYLPGPSESADRVVIAEGSVVQVDDRLDKFSIEGTFNDVPFATEMVGGKIIELRELAKPWPLDGSFSVAGATLKANGKLMKTQTARSFDLRVAVTGDRLSDLNPLLGADLPSLGPYQLAGQVSTLEDSLNVKDLSAKIGGTDVAGHLALTTTGPRVRLSGALAAHTLQLDDFRSGDAALTSVHAARPSEPFAIPVDALRSVDAEVSLEAKNVVVREARLEQVGLTAGLRDGLLHVDPFAAEIFGGQVQGTLALDVRESVANAALELKATSLDYGKALKSSGITSQVEGSTDLTVSLATQGSTVRELLERAALQMNAGPSSLILGEAKSDERVSLGIGEARVAMAEGGPLKALVKGSFRQKPIDVSLVTGTLSSLMGDSGTWPITLSARAVDASLSAKGTIRSEARGIGGALAASLRGGQLSSLDPDLPSLGPYVLRARLSKKGDSYRVTDLMGRLGGSDMVGALTINFEEPRPRLSGQLSCQRLNLADFSTPGDVDIPVDLLRSLDADISMQAEVVKVGPTRVGDLSLRADLRAGVLTVVPVQGRFLDKKAVYGEVQGSLELDAAARVPTLSVKTSVKDLNYGRLLRSLQLTDQIEGVGTFHLVFSGEGPSLFTLLLAQPSFEVNAEQMQMVLHSKEKARPQIVFTQARMIANEGGPLQLRATGRVKDTPFTLTSSSGRLRDLLAQTGQWPLTVSARSANASLSMEGQVHLPLDGKNFTLQLAADSKRLSDLAPWVDGLPDVGPFEAAGSLAQTKEGLGLTGFRARLAGNDVAGSLALVTTAARPRVVGKLTTARFVLGSLLGERSGSGEQADPSLLQEVTGPVRNAVEEIREEVTEIAQGEQDESVSSQAEDHRVFPDFAFPVDALRGVDLELDWKVKEVRAPATELGDLAFKVKLDDGALTVAPFRGRLWGGMIDGSLMLDVSGSLPRLAVKTRIDDLDYGRFFSSMEISDLVTGHSDHIKVDLEGRGKTLREVLSSANGQFEVVDRQLQISTDYIDLWAGNLIRVAMSAAWQKKEVTKFNCAVGYFEVVNGEVKTDALLFDTKRATIVGIGTLDLQTEELDVILTPRPHDPALISAASTVRLTGPLADPDVTNDRLSISKGDAWTLLGFVNPFGFALVIPKVTGTTLGTDDKNPCEAAMQSWQHAAQKVVQVRRGFFERVKDFFTGGSTSSNEPRDREVQGVPVR